MSKEPDWVKVVIEQTIKTHESVARTAVSRVEELLKTQLTERQLPAAELRSIATALISDLTRQQLDTEVEDEN